MHSLIERTYFGKVARVSKNNKIEPSTPSPFLSGRALRTGTSTHEQLRQVFDEKKGIPIPLTDIFQYKTIKNHVPNHSKDSVDLIRSKLILTIAVADVKNDLKNKRKIQNTMEQNKRRTEI